MNIGQNGLGDKDMSRLSKTLLFWTFLLGACSPSLPTPQPVPESDVPTPTLFQPSDIVTLTEASPSIPQTVIAANPPSLTTTVTPDASFSATECGYQWAYQDLPELTAQFDQSMRNLIPNSNSRATVFGENCIGNDGQVVRFLAMETDFYVTASVETLDDYETLGNWIAQVMQVISRFPPGLIAGPKPGFVEFRFEKSVSESLAVRIPTQQYNETANGKTGEELLRMFYTTP